jgi:hypothetical protein
LTFPHQNASIFIGAHFAERGELIEQIRDGDISQLVVRSWALRGSGGIAGSFTDR